jgi:hypothetical protein
VLVVVALDLFSNISLTLMFFYLFRVFSGSLDASTSLKRSSRLSKSLHHRLFHATIPVAISYARLHSLASLKHARFAVKSIRKLSIKEFRVNFITKHMSSISRGASTAIGAIGW